VAEIPPEVEAELARLRTENARLLRLLKLTPQQAALPGPAQAGLFEAPPGVVHHGSPPAAKVAFFGALFAARTDVYAVRFDNRRTGKAGWVPAVRGGWRKGVRHEERDYLPLTGDVLAAHLWLWRFAVAPPGRLDLAPRSAAPRCAFALVLGLPCGPTPAGGGAT
jgi:hypothetical protein